MCAREQYVCARAQVGDYVDADLSSDGVPVWRGVVVLEARAPDSFVVTPLDGPAGHFAVWVDAIAPFRTRSTGRTQSKRTTHLASESRVSDAVLLSSVGPCGHALTHSHAPLFPPCPAARRCCSQRAGRSP